MSEAAHPIAVSGGRLRLLKAFARETLEAATRIGLDLHALRVEALETESREQRRRADLLERQMQRAIKAGARS